MKFEGRIPGFLPMISSNIELTNFWTKICNFLRNFWFLIKKGISLFLSLQKALSWFSSVIMKGNYFLWTAITFGHSPKRRQREGCVLSPKLNICNNSTTSQTSSLINNLRSHSNAVVNKIDTVKYIYYYYYIYRDVTWINYIPLQIM